MKKNNSDNFYLRTSDDYKDILVDLLQTGN
jgi:hypothetical protein